VGHQVSTPVFEGPIEVLLHLVSAHEVDVLEVPMAPVVDGFLRTLAERRQELSVDTLSEFLLIAAILLELKSQRLLPGQDEVDEDEELGTWEERDLLLARLLECRAYAAAAEVLVEWAERAERSVPRLAGLDDDVVVHAPDLLAGVTAQRLAAAYLSVVTDRPAPQVDLSHVTVDTVTVSEAVQELAEVLPHSPATTFGQLTRGCRSRIEVIVRFLALLELCKVGRVTLGQGHTFGELEVRWIDGGSASGVAGEWLEAVGDYAG
jgi:segregation and condensation protein A